MLYDQFMINFGYKFHNIFFILHSRKTVSFIRLEILSVPSKCFNLKLFHNSHWSKFTYILFFYQVIVRIIIIFHFILMFSYSDEMKLIINLCCLLYRQRRMNKIKLTENDKEKMHIQYKMYIFCGCYNIL